MSNILDFQSRQKGRSTSRSNRRKIGRDFLAVLFLGAGLGLSVASIEDGPARAMALLERSPGQLQAFLKDPSTSPAPAEDEFPVSSIGKKPVKEKAEPVGRQFAVCSIKVGTRDNCVIDGDTFTFDGTTIRISDIDAPETHPPRCAREADLGDRATRRLSALLSSGPFRLIRDGRDIDRYGRKLRIVIRDGRSVGRMLVSEGLARPWTGKRRPWCGNDRLG